MAEWKEESIKLEEEFEFMGLGVMCWGKVVFQLEFGWWFED